MGPAVRAWRRPRTATAAAVVVVAVVMSAGLVVGVAGASTGQRRDQDVTNEQFVALVRRAATDDAVVGELRRVRSVDGRPVDVSLALQGDEVTVRRRLVGLAATVDRTGRVSRRPGPDRRAGVTARREAEQVLRRNKYQRHALPQPFRGVLRWLGQRLEPVLGPVGRFFDQVTSTLGGKLLVAALVAAVAAVVAQRLVNGRSRAAVTRRRTASLVDPGADPDALERQAADAEARGDHRRAVRLHYQAGLVRLDRSGTIDLRPDTTTGGLVEALRSPPFDAVTSDFEHIVYGGRAASSIEVRSARHGWSEVLDEQRRVRRSSGRGSTDQTLTSAGR